MKKRNKYSALLGLALISFAVAVLVAVICFCTIGVSHAFRGTVGAFSLPQGPVDDVEGYGLLLEGSVRGFSALLLLFGEGFLLLAAFFLPGAVLLAGVVFALAARLFQLKKPARWKRRTGAALSGIWLAGVVLTALALLFCALMIWTIGPSWQWGFWAELGLLLTTAIIGLRFLFRRENTY